MHTKEENGEINMRGPQLGPIFVFPCSVKDWSFYLSLADESQCHATLETISVLFLAKFGQIFDQKKMDKGKKNSNIAKNREGKKKTRKSAPGPNTALFRYHRNEIKREIKRSRDDILDLI